MYACAWGVRVANGHHPGAVASSGGRARSKRVFHFHLLMVRLLSLSFRTTWSSTSRWCAASGCGGSRGWAARARGTMRAPPHRAPTRRATRGAAAAGSAKLAAAATAAAAAATSRRATRCPSSRLASRDSCWPPSHLEYGRPSAEAAAQAAPPLARRRSTPRACASRGGFRGPALGLRMVDVTPFVGG